MKEELKSLFAEIVGLNNVIDDPALFGPYTDDFTDHYVSKPLAVVRPSTTEQTLRSIQRSHRHPGRQYKSDRRSDNLSTGC